MFVIPAMYFPSNDHFGHTNSSVISLLAARTLISFKSISSLPSYSTFIAFLRCTAWILQLNRRDIKQRNSYRRPRQSSNAYLHDSLTQKTIALVSVSPPGSSRTICLLRCDLWGRRIVPSSSLYSLLSAAHDAPIIKLSRLWPVLRVVWCVLI